MGTTRAEADREGGAAGAGRGLALRELGVGIEACLASPKVRAVETARIACEALGIEVEETEALRGGAFDALDLAAGRGEVLLVGHEPDFSRRSGGSPARTWHLKKGGIAVVDGSTLVALWRPKELRRIAGLRLVDFDPARGKVKSTAAVVSRRSGRRCP